MMLMFIHHYSTATRYEQVYGVITDRQGSIMALYNTHGNIVYETTYDAWGRERNPISADYTATTTRPIWIIRGYTGHEHLTEFGLINMNGRMYDPLVARMLSPDNFVQDATSTQGFNRFAYAYNNPLKYKDPSGELFVVDDAILITIAIGAISGGIAGWQIGKAAGATGWGMVGYIAGGAAIGSVAGALGGYISANSGMVFGSIVSGGIGGAGMGALEGTSYGLRGSELFEYAGRSGLYGSISGFVGSVSYLSIGGSFGAALGGASSNLTNQFLSNNENVNWLSVGLSGLSSMGIYYLNSYVNYKNSVANIKFAGMTITFKQYLSMQASYTRANFWHSEWKGGGFWLTRDGDISTEGVLPPNDDKINEVRFSFPRPKDAWASFHPHPFNTSEAGLYDIYGLGNNELDIRSVNKHMFPSFVLHQHGLNFHTPAPIFNMDVNFWPYGRNDFLWLYFAK